MSEIVGIIWKFQRFQCSIFFIFHDCFCLIFVDSTKKKILSIVFKHIAGQNQNLFFYYYSCYGSFRGDSTTFTIIFMRGIRSQQRKLTQSPYCIQSLFVTKLYPLEFLIKHFGSVTHGPCHGDTKFIPLVIICWLLIDFFQLVVTQSLNASDTHLP